MTGVRSLDIRHTGSGRYSLVTRMAIDASVNEAFAFFSEAENLNVITPDWLRFRISTVAPIEMKAGTIIDYRLRLHRVPFNWTSEIRDWSPPFQFRDVQIKGPFKLWSHLHRFTELSSTSTLVEDFVDYAVPGNRLINWLFVERDVRRIFAYRQEALAAQFRVSP